jgi:dTMP kinase
MTKNKKQKGKLIAIYGINNIGKTTQVKLLKEKLEELGNKVVTVKYPIYDLAPTGPQINAYLREGNPQGFSPEEIQLAYANNRKDSTEKLKELLLENDFVILEDYTGTGISWGMGRGVSKDYLIEINKDLLKEDLAVLMDGKRFLKAEEKNHMHENNYELTNKVRQAHLELAKQFGWKIVNANQSIEEVNKNILENILNN